VTVENAQYIAGLNPNWPLGEDFIYEGDDQIRITKKAIQQSFPNIDGPVTATPAELNELAGVGSVWTTGDIKMAVYDSAQNGWIRCDGAVIPVLPENNALIALVGANAPDLRGAFVRGWSDDALVDPDGPRAPLSAQGEMIGPHTHPGRVWSLDCSACEAFKSGGGSSTADAETEENTGIENRPGNIALAYFIKT